MVPSQLVVIDDTNTATIPQSATGVIFEPNVFQKIQYWLSRDPVAKMGHGKMWAWGNFWASYDLTRWTSARRTCSATPRTASTTTCT